MSFSDLFNSGFTTRNQDHFASIVRVAFSDNIISQEEKCFLDRLAQNLDISKETYLKIFKNYKSHPINPPISQDSRIERLYDLARMVYADDIKDAHEVTILRKIVIGLGFQAESVAKVVSTSLNLVSNKVEFDTFKKEMKTVF
ncbi:MAG: TerB family tellurite resistance protein [Flavobacteriaceae bacterium]|jgi:uncharacterized tellurite resistance protein B-like protein|nr:TerB family tellurite resistance protein [Flavobacteriaceae bacterium]MDA7849422.1 TerB family tellurite resistance protein [Flavobacteriaceae bacterium]MDG1309870.1 TerB family tellurite resistance protein [Flavobacteriaceae bacterium]